MVVNYFAHEYHALRLAVNTVRARRSFKSDIAHQIGAQRGGVALTERVLETGVAYATPVMRAGVKKL
jgi:hypothetical protein